jgi:hypothetical protein
MSKERENTGQIQVQRDKNGRFMEGTSGNLRGKPKGSRNYLTLLEEAIKKYETEKGKKLFDRLIERAFVNDTVLLSVIKKFIPDREKTESETPEPVIITLHHVTNRDEVEQLKNTIEE